MGDNLVTQRENEHIISQNRIIRIIQHYVLFCCCLKSKMLNDIQLYSQVQDVNHLHENILLCNDCELVFNGEK